MYNRRTYFKTYASGVYGLIIGKLLKLKIKTKRERKNNGNNRGKETNKEFGARHRIFGVWPRSKGSALIDCLTHHAGGTPLR